MSGMFINKLAGSFLAAGLGFIMINKFSGVVMHPDVPKPEKFAYSLAAEAPVQHVEVVEVAFPSPAWLGARDAAKGAKVFKKCKSCHTLVAGGKDGTGPALWNIVGRPKASVDGFSYSDGMRAKGGNWGYAELNEFLTKPKDYITKTKMSFNGLKKETDRAALIEYLRVSADAPIEQWAMAEVETVQEAAQETVDGGVEKITDTVKEVVPADGGH